MKQVPLLSIILTLFSCVSLKNDVRVLPEQSELFEPVEEAVAEKSVFLDTISFIAPKDWVNKRFVLLEKPPLFTRYGYEIYRCTDAADGCRTAVDTSYELSNSRIRYDIFVGDTLLVTEVHPDSNEWRISFREEKYSLDLYARTHKGALKDLLLVRDLYAAKKRWVGKMIYSRKGVISIEGNNGMLSGFKVSRTTALKVYDLQSGLSPLPVNPLWLMVLAPGDVKGFIPLRISWTNTMKDQIYDGVAWADDILEQNPSTIYNWDSETWDLVENHRIAVNMNQEQVFLSWGRPLSKLQKSYNGVEAECWIYSSQELYFDQRGLFAIENITK